MILFWTQCVSTTHSVNTPMMKKGGETHHHLSILFMQERANTLQGKEASYKKNTGCVVKFVYPDSIDLCKFDVFTALLEHVAGPPTLHPPQAC